MKKLVVLSFVLYGFSTVYSNDLIEKIQKLTLENDSLKKQIVKPLRDSVSIFKNKIEKLDKDLAAANKKLTDLDKNKVKIENDSLKKQVIKPLRDSISIFKSKIEKSDKENKEMEKKISEKDGLIAQKYAEGQQNVYSQIAQVYNKPFDELIKLHTKQLVERNLLLVGNDEKARKKLQDLQKYFAAEQTLEERYNEQKVKNSQSQIAGIEQTSEVKNLVDKLRDYKLCNDALKATIDKILEIDKKFVANSENTQNDKQRDILFELSWYFRNYRFNFIDYPYLSKIVLEIMDLKQKDANADIKHLSNKL
ncbi:MAG: hypothetical protein LBQ76_01820 [Candidatus Fibromonas sp.]|nr:hypothetical protein [Candidatus Fibromonas sp.]